MSDVLPKRVAEIRVAVNAVLPPTSSLREMIGDLCDTVDDLRAKQDKIVKAFNAASELAMGQIDNLREQLREAERAEGERIMQTLAERLHLNLDPGDSESDWIGDTIGDMVVAVIRRLTDALRWALGEIGERKPMDSNGTPEHDCQFIHEPNVGACRWHEEYWTAMELVRGERALAEIGGER